MSAWYERDLERLRAALKAIAALPTEREDVPAVEADHSFLDWSDGVAAGHCHAVEIARAALGVKP